MSSQPTQTCALCGNVEVVTPDGRGFPPKIAENRLKRRCKADGCPCEPKYRAGIDPDSHLAYTTVEDPA